MKLKTIDKRQTAGWYFASLIFGLNLLVIFFTIGPGGAEATDDAYITLALIVFSIVWIFGVCAIRIYIQDKDPFDFRSLLGFGKKPDK